jgi:mannose-6-phosphate isomerase-like protein (cupin superfamily)
VLLVAIGGSARRSPTKSLAGKEQDSMAGDNEVLELIDAPGRVALIRKQWQPTAITGVTARGTPDHALPRLGRIVGDRLEPPDMLNVALPPMRVIVGDGLLVEVAKRIARVPLWHRNLRADELVFAHRGEAACDAELGTVHTAPGEAHLRPLGCAHRVVPDASGAGTFNIIFESRAPFQLSPAAARGWVNAALDWPLDLTDTNYVESLDGDSYNLLMQRDVRPSQITGVDAPPPLAPPMQFGKVDVAALAREGPAEWDGSVVWVTTEAGVRISASAAARCRDYWHRNLRCDELLVVHEGTLGVETELGTLALAPGDMAIVPRGVSHHLRPSADGLFLTLEAPQALQWTDDARVAWEPAASAVPAGSA